MVLTVVLPVLPLSPDGSPRHRSSLAARRNFDAPYLHPPASGAADDAVRGDRVGSSGWRLAAWHSSKAKVATDQEAVASLLQLGSGVDPAGTRTREEARAARRQIASPSPWSTFDCSAAKPYHQQTKRSSTASSSAAAAAVHRPSESLSDKRQRTTTAASTTPAITHRGLLLGGPCGNGGGAGRRPVGVPRPPLRHGSTSPARPPAKKITYVNVREEAREMRKGETVAVRNHGTLYAYTSFPPSSLPPPPSLPCPSKLKVAETSRLYITT